MCDRRLHGLQAARLGCNWMPPKRSSRPVPSLPIPDYREFPCNYLPPAPGSVQNEKLAMTAAELEAMIKAEMEDIGESSYGKTLDRRGLVGGRNISLR